MKQKTTLLLAVAVLIQPTLHVSANTNEGTISSKDEVIYANLQTNGSVDELYVVNALDVEEEGTILDYGAYDQITNLTDLSEITQNDNEIELNVPTGMFYYQGNLEQQSQLPWAFEITYALNGEQLDGADLLGREGELELAIQVTQNEDIDPAFFENYMLQISIPLNSQKFSDINAPEATIANAGQNKQLTYTVMPEEEADFTLTATVSDFEFEGIEIAALPSSFAIDSPDTEELTGEFDSLTGAISDLTTGLGDLHEGLNGLSSGLYQLKEGSSNYQAGMSETAGAGSELVFASSAIKQSLNDLNEGLQGDSMEATDFDLDIGLDDELFDALSQFSGGMTEIGSGIEELSTNYEQAYNALKTEIDDIPDHDIAEEDIQQLYENNPDSETVDMLVETYAASKSAKGTFEAVDEAFAAVAPALAEIKTSVLQIGEGIDAFSSSIEEALSEMEDIDFGAGLDELKNGIDELATQYGSFHNGLNEYANGVSELSGAYDEIHSGIEESAGGTNELSSGLSEVHQGMGELEKATAEIPDEMQTEIDEMIAQYDKSDYEAISFVSPENNDIVKNVQFVIQTESVKLVENNEEADDDEDEPSIWQRFLQLFNWG
ncbi:hypothetical protein [Shouchella patagoniensis]|uniref:hypothetical protein n=1 Tax=Shouchella patagoniensis TaxID=228576 RepID=UPI000994CF80|nr:hypothetical protein [Shouchella patagoniensis]